MFSRQGLFSLPISLSETFKILSWLKSALYFSIWESFFLSIPPDQRCSGSLCWSIPQCRADKGELVGLGVVPENRTLGHCMHPALGLPALAWLEHCRFFVTACVSSTSDNFFLMFNFQILAQGVPSSNFPESCLSLIFTFLLVSRIIHYYVPPTPPSPISFSLSVRGVSNGSRPLRSLMPPLASDASLEWHCWHLHSSKSPLLVIHLVRALKVLLKFINSLWKVAHLATF